MLDYVASDWHFHTRIAMRVKRIPQSRMVRMIAEKMSRIHISCALPSNHPHRRQLTMALLISLLVRMFIWTCQICVVCIAIPKLPELYFPPRSLAALVPLTPACLAYAQRLGHIMDHDQHSLDLLLADHARRTWRSDVVKRYHDSAR